jgi:hypothetical protein
MVSHSNGRAASLLDSAGPGTCRPAVSPVSTATTTPPVAVDDGDDQIVVRISLCEGPVELRVPRAAVKAGRPRGHIEGFNADATPC